MPDLQPTTYPLKPIVRMPPSPTGLFHMGSVRTALYNYLFAKKHGGTFLLRIEDTDKERSKPEFEKDIIESLEWLGLSYDGFSRQSERGETYRKHLEKLIAEDKAYVSKETPKEEGQRSEVIRFRNPGTSITFTDLIRGDITFDTTELGDFVIAKSLDEVLYHFAVVVDDVESGITHVIRGEDHLSNTPRQILILEALGGTRPLYAHLPLILDEKRAKLSKRKHGEIVSLSYYKKQGYLPEAILNFMALLGWNPGTEQEIFTIPELIEAFSLDHVHKGGAVFDTTKLTWINKEHLLKLPPDVQNSMMKSWIENVGVNLPEGMFERLLPTLKERAGTRGDVETMKKNGDFDYFEKDPVYEANKLLWKGGGTLEATKEKLKTVEGLISSIQKPGFTKDDVKEAVWPYAESSGRGNVLWPLRLALSGKEKSPDPFTLSEILGKEETLKRISHAISLIS